MNLKNKIKCKRYFELFRPNSIDEYFVLFYFVGQFLLDFLQKINSKFNLEFQHYHRYIKAIFLFYLLISFLINFKSFFKNKILKYIIFICFIFTISNNYSSSRVEYFIQYSFFFSVVLFFHFKEKLRLSSLKEVINIIVVLNFILIILGVIFDLSLFETYTSRFGYNGIIITSMQATVFYFSAFAISIYYKNLLGIILVSICAFLCGTKTLLLGIPLMLLLYYILDKNKGRFKYGLLLAFIISVIGLVSLFSSNLFRGIIEKDGFITAFFSHRDHLLSSTFGNLKEHSSLYHFLFGGFDLVSYKTEFDFVDIFIFFGIIGLMFFFLIFKYIYYHNCVSAISKAYFITIIVAAFFSGNIIVYPFNSFMFLITLKLMYDSKQS